MLKKQTGLKTCYGNFENVYKKNTMTSGSNNLNNFTFINGSVFNLHIMKNEVNNNINMIILRKK